MRNPVAGGIGITILIVAVLIVIGLAIWAPNVYKCGKMQCCAFPQQTGKDCKSCNTGYAGEKCSQCAQGYEPEATSARMRMRARMQNALPVESKCVKSCPFPGQKPGDCASCRKPGYETTGAKEKCTSCEQGFSHVGPEPEPGEPDTRPCAPEESPPPV